MEADTGSETISYSQNPDTTTIGGKFNNYLDLIKERRFKKSMAVFYTTRLTRMESMIRALQYAIARKMSPAITQSISPSLTSPTTAS